MADATPKRLPLLRLFIFTFAGAVMSAIISFVVCSHTTNVWVWTAVLPALIATWMTPLMRWWLRASRAAGVPKTTTYKKRRFVLGMSMLAVTAAYIFVEVRVFDLTHNRIFEMAIAVIVVACSGRYYFPRAVALMPFENEASRKLMRFTALTQIGIVFIFSLSAWLQMIPMHHDYGLSGLHELTLAGYYVLIPMAAMYAYYVLRRLSELNSGTAAPST